MQDTGQIYGAEQATINLADQLNQQEGFSAHIFLINETRLTHLKKEVFEAIRARKIPFTRLDVSRAFSLRLVKTIRYAFKAKNGDVLHTSGYKADIHGWLALHKKAPVVSTVHGWLCRPEFKERFYGWLNMVFLRRFDRVVVLSRYYEQKMTDAKVPGASVIRIASGMSRAPGYALPPESRSFTVGILGRLSWEKNHDLFLHAAARIHAAGEPVVRFLIAGDGPQKSAIREQIKKLGLEDVVMLKGYMEREAFFGEIDVLVLCSHIENLPYCILEAMARSIPVIATRVGGVPDLIDHRETGLLVQENEKELAGAVLELARDSKSVRALGNAARDKLKEEFSPEQWMQKHQEMYRSVTSAR